MAWWWWFYMPPRLSRIWSSWSTASHNCNGCHRWSEWRKWMSSSGFKLAGRCFKFIKLYGRRKTVRTFDITICSRWSKTWNCKKGIYLWCQIQFIWKIWAVTICIFKYDQSDKLEWLKLKCKPGDVVFFNSFVPHFSVRDEKAISIRSGCPRLGLLVSIFFSS